MNGVTLLIPTLILIHQHLGYTLYMLIKRKRIIECNIFMRTKSTDLYSRCIDCSKYAKISLTVCRLVQDCDKVNTGLHNFSGTLKYVM
jgi:hypothetical protein